MFSLVVLSILVMVVVATGLGNMFSRANQDRDDADATATTQAITVKDLAQMHAALDPRIPDWLKVTDLEVHHISASDAGFAANTNTKEVVYGYCAVGKFYVYVLEISRPGGFIADTEGYAYTPNSVAAACHPPNWRIVDEDIVESGWSFVTISTSQATNIARATLMSTYVAPTASATPEMF